MNYLLCHLLFYALKKIKILVSRFFFFFSDCLQWEGWYCPLACCSPTQMFPIFCCLNKMERIVEKKQPSFKRAAIW
jgi:hypothetical protein